MTFVARSALADSEILYMHIQRLAAAPFALRASDKLRLECKVSFDNRCVALLCVCAHIVFEICAMKATQPFTRETF